jgi:tRNA(Ile)-lysidine synthase TilS/MesJ/rhodanese-related sulfurtransferase
MEEKMELTWQEVQALPEGSYTMIDIRNASAVSYGMIPGAVNIPENELDDRREELPQDQAVILVCTKGVFSLERVEELREDGMDHVYSLKGGYNGWLIASMEADRRRDEEIAAQREKERIEEEEAAKRNAEQSGADGTGVGETAGSADGQPVLKKKKDRVLTKAEEVEKSLRKRFHKDIFSKFAKAINTYELVKPGDKIAVCISGGKDSMLMAKLFQEIKHHNKFDFDLVFLCMDPGYSEANRKVIENNAQMLNIPIVFFESTIFDVVYDIEKSPCYLCARMRRGYLYSKAKELGCNKIALGHHYDDVIETILMGMLYGGQMQTMMPKLHSSNFEGMELIRPLYLVREDDIKRWRDYNGLHFIQCACKFTDTCTTCRPDGTGYSKRVEVKNLIAQLKKTNPYVEGNIFKSVENVNLSTIVAYKEHGVRHHFLDTYDQEKMTESSEE